VRKGFNDIVNAEVVYNPIVHALEPPVRSGSADPDELKCMFLFNFLPYKGIYETIHAAGLLKARKDIHFYIAGSNIRKPEFYHSWYGRLLNWAGLAPDIEAWIRTYIAENALTNVTLLGHVDDINDLIQGMDVNLAPVRLNSPPRSVFEAAAFEVPTILALTDVVEDLLEHGVTGLIIPPRDPSAIADAIIKLRDNESLRRTLGANARLKLMKLHDPQAGADGVLKIYKSVIKSDAIGKIAAKAGALH
jgi:glycosyltransferase involved in cell wall biosynthesis